MEKTSRRKFGTQLTGALAALPAFSLGVKAAEEAQEKKQPEGAKKKKQAEGPQKKKPTIVSYKSTHDTPPPTEILDGSWKAHSSTILVESRDNASNRWNYDKKAFPYIVHVKVLHGSGDTIYRNLIAKDTVKEIRVSLTGAAGNLVITGGVYFDADRNPLFRINSSKKLDYYYAVKGKRRHQYEHPGGSGDFRVESIDIVDTSGRSLFFVKPPVGTTDPEEYRLMIWHEHD